MTSRADAPRALPAYYPRLDGLRALAVLMVMAYHWLPYRFLHQASFGVAGVTLFFVLSGFLITQILLQARAQAETPWRAARQFYVRRFLRIFPVYYATLAALALSGFESVRAELPWHLAYASNVLFFRRGRFSEGVAHFWSLAVEEQFYLLWPWLIILVPRLAVRSCVRATMALGLGSYLVLAALGVPLFGVLLNAQLFSLGLGALLAVSAIDKGPPTGQRTFWPLAACLVGWLIAAWAQGTFLHEVIGLFLALAGYYVVKEAAFGPAGPAATLLMWPPLAYLGRISYGLYLFHNLAQWFVPYWAQRVGLALPEPPLPRAGLYFLVTLLSATGSWLLYERPINALKERFPYSAR